MIIHVDMDAFYASIEQRDQPELAGQPVAVGGTPSARGVVAAASYEARQFGVHSAMPSRTAVRLCPRLVLVPMRMEYYAEISRQIGEIFGRYTPMIEPLALDEAFLDVSGSTRLFGDAVTIGRRIKEEIQSELNLTASIGIAPNKFIAKIASDLQKPDGLVTVSPPLAPFLDPLPIQRLWGIGRVAEEKLQAAGIHTLLDFRNADPKVLGNCVGNATEKLLRLARGEDNRPVQPHLQSVSISKETTFKTNIKNITTLENTLLRLTEQVAERLRNKHLSARTISIKIRHADFRTLSRSQTLSHATNTTQEIWNIVRSLFRTAIGEQFAVRLIGVQVSSIEDLTGSLQLQMSFGELERQKKIDAVVDEVNQRFGTGTVRRGINSP